MADRGSAPCDGIVGRSRRHALIDSRSKLTMAQVGERLCAEIERERSGGVRYWALFDHRNGEFVGCGGLRPWLSLQLKRSAPAATSPRDAFAGWVFLVASPRSVQCGGPDAMGA